MGQLETKTGFFWDFQSVTDMNSLCGFPPAAKAPYTPCFLLRLPILAALSLTAVLLCYCAAGSLGRCTVWVWVCVHVTSMCAWCVSLRGAWACPVAAAVAVVALVVPPPPGV